MKKKMKCGIIFVAVLVLLCGTLSSAAEIEPRTLQDVPFKFEFYSENGSTTVNSSVESQFATEAASVYVSRAVGSYSSIRLYARVCNLNGVPIGVASNQKAPRLGWMNLEYTSTYAGGWSQICLTGTGASVNSVVEGQWHP